MFLTPLTRILTAKGSEVDCLTHTPVKHEINGVWVGFNTKITDTKAPTQLPSRLEFAWSYKSPKNFI